MRVHPRQSSPTYELRQRVGRLEQIPLRALTARSVMGHWPGEGNDSDLDVHLTPKLRSICQLDPGWALLHPRIGKPSEVLSLIATVAWWPPGLSTGPSAEFIGRLWRHSAFVSLAARALAKEANDPDADGVGRAGLLCRLGWWAVAAIDPEWLVKWWREADPQNRRKREISDLGTDLSDLGRRFAERFGCEPLTVDAVWLHGSHGPALLNAAAEPTRLAYIQQASRWAEQTPWALGSAEIPKVSSSEPRLRVLIAEVQARTASAFGTADATLHEERMTRQNARLRLLLAQARRDRDRGARFLDAVADSSPSTAPEDLATRAAMFWCAEPGVSAARLVWVDKPTEGPMASGKQTRAAVRKNGSPESALEPRPPAFVLPLTLHGKTRAEIHLWSDGEGQRDQALSPDSAAHRALQSWTAMLSDRAALEDRIQTVVEALRQQIEREESRLEALKLEALAEFAAGAGHELNNPLAVIVGRAQLLLGRTDDPETSRSLRIILSQAGRAHRILRDLMFVARPPAPRPRLCRPAELLRACLRDLQEECNTRGIRLTGEIADLAPLSSLDPDALRHLADSLLRNAIQATASGGKIVVRSQVRGDELSWSFADSGQGISASDAAHLFDPFYSGRQAGRGLGLGLPRAARMVAQAGGRLQWSSNPGHGTLFHVHLPISPVDLKAKTGAPHVSPAALDGNRSAAP